MTESQPEYLTIVHEVKDPIHRAQLLGEQWVSAAHGHVIAQMCAMDAEQKQIDTIKATLSADKYPGSKDWREGSTLERIEWLHDGYASAKEEIERLTTDVLNLQAMLAKANNQAEHFERHWYLRGDEIESLQAKLDAVGAGGVEPLRKSNSPEFGGIKEPAAFKRISWGRIKEMASWFDLVQQGGEWESAEYQSKIEGFARCVEMECLHQIQEPQPARQPLDDKRIYELYCDAMQGHWVESFHHWRLKERNQARAFVRAIEKAHGITSHKAGGSCQLADESPELGAEPPELGAEPPELSADVYQHKSGGLYRIVCEAADLSMHNPQVVYCNIETSECWVRPKSEFEDGRFKRVPAEHVVDANKMMGAPNR